MRGERAIDAGLPDRVRGARSAFFFRIGRQGLALHEPRSLDRVEEVGWLLNLQANPDVELTVAGQDRALRARVASPEEKAELWPQIVAAYKGYAGYQSRTSRDIPVVICEPR